MVVLRDLNWLGDAALTPGTYDVYAKVRSTRPPQPARLIVTGEGVEVELLAGEYGVSPGQACVIYDSDETQSRVLGGGWIVAARAPAMAPGGAFERSETVAAR